LSRHAAVAIRQVAEGQRTLLCASLLKKTKMQQLKLLKTILMLQMQQLLVRLAVDIAGQQLVQSLEPFRVAQ
jgi:hypothetical protein